MVNNSTSGKPVLCTIGYTKKSLRRFIQLLLDAGVEKVVDIRRNNTSQLAGFSKKDDLAYILSLVNIDYEHIIDLSPSAQLLARYHKDHDWAAFVADFRKEGKERQMLELAKQLAYSPQRLCLLCTEDRPDHCHRRIVAEWIKSLRQEIEIIHLV
ncbi:MAG: DUF488 domain-containing protein [Limnochordales bacterium]|nr:DUF488 domain-containing protein [Limnochordales bacterium]